MPSQMEKALKIALDAHSGQTDRYGAPYILHPLRVMMRVRTETEKIVAILHDIIEDSSWTGDMLLKEGFSQFVVSSVEALSKKPGEDYMDYIRKTTTNEVSIQVKLADLSDNLDLNRCSEVNADDIQRFNRYLKARSYLKKYLKHSDNSHKREV
jgi:(p)ppGpp synthase/HD superfamily hydrolase